MEEWKGKVAIVTGASSGIGAAISERLVVAGVKVVGLARRQEKLEMLAQKLQETPGSFYPLKTDITRELDILNAFKWVKTNVGPIHAMINNAGIMNLDTLIDGQTENWKTTLDTNVLGLCITTREAIKDMRENRIDGHIININSVSGHIVPNLPRRNVYPASKHAVTALTETLRQELNSTGSKIKVCSISPGFVNTDEDEDLGTIKERPMLEVSDVVDAVCYVLSTPSHVQIHELIIKPVGEAF